MAEKVRRKTPSETIELTEALIVHGDSLSGTDAQKAAKLEAIRAGLRERGIDFVDQEEAFEIWLNPSDKEQVLELLQSLGYRPDVYRL
ncbi:MAG: hypothetical protein QHJ73_04630 [Armatimonadota bacterium]|jgi:hypothetical protein|nr:hypothetical protein [Armatimonadota bacterium]